MGTAFDTGENARARSHGGSFGCQFLSTLKLAATHRIRSPIITIVELLIPIVFIVGTTILYAVIDDVEQTGEDFVHYNAMDEHVALQNRLFSSLCYNSSLSNGSIDGLEDCGGMNQRAWCAGTSDGIPINGVCIAAGESPLSSAGDLMRVLSAYEAGLMPIPTFDEMVKLQWISKCISSIGGFRGLSGSIDRSGWLYALPESEDTKLMVSSMNASTSLFKYVFNRYFKDQEEADVFLRDNPSSIGNWGLIRVKKLSTDLTSPLLEMDIFLNSSAIPSTSKVLTVFYDGGVDTAGSDYILSGFLSLQGELFRQYITETLKIAAPPIPVVVPMGTVTFVRKTFLTMAGNMVPLLVVLGFLFPVQQATKRIVLEKELRLKEAMLIMGLRQSVQYTAWFVFAVAQYAVISLIITVILKQTYMAQTDAFLMYCLFFLYSMSLVSFSGLVASFFSKARLSSILTPVIYFALSMPLFAISGASSTVVTALCILSPSAFASGISLMFNYETVNGFGMEDFWNSSDSPNMASIFLLLVVDNVLYLFLMLYLDAVLPNDWGTPRHPLFCIIEPFSCLWRSKTEDEKVDGRNAKGAFEPLTEEEVAASAVKICGLTKNFSRDGKTFLAVNHLHWSLVEGGISVLLGHNGAGKSTTMNMMTGMLKPDGGDCYIYGHSIRKNLNAARQEIGYCPQHNILWPKLTCREHLEYFSSIKGLSYPERREMIETILANVDLSDKADYPSSALSGGQKRKLSVAIAFVGNSRLIFLDEPTAGMDVAARRHTWELLRKMAAGRTILLSTHFMDEADLLGDRIAIMSQGRLQCSGSSVFLKSNLGVGYNITMSLDREANRESISKLIHSFVPSAELLNSGAGEMSFRLPMSFVSQFPAMLAEVETAGKSNGIQGYTLSATTLEEIFLRIAQSESLGSNESTELAGSQDSLEKLNEDMVKVEANIPSIWGADFIHSSQLGSSQLKASLLKRCRVALRDRRTQCFQIVFPVLMVFLAVLLSMINFRSREPLLLSSNMYGGPVRIDLANCQNTVNPSVSFASNAELFPHDDIQGAESFSRYLKDSYFHHAAHRYTSMACNDARMNGSAAVFYNMSSPHSIAVGVIGYYGAIVQRGLVGNTVKYSEDIFPTEIVPMVRTKEEDAFVDAMKTLMIGLLIIIPFTFIPSTFVSWVVKERECKARHLQNISGLRFSIYWLSNYLFDVASYIVMMLLVIIVLLIFGRREYVSAETFLPTFLLLLTYGLSGVAMSYAISFLFNEHSNAQNIVMLFGFVTGFVLVLLKTILALIPTTQSAATVLQWVFRIFPTFCVSDGLVGLAFHEGGQVLTGGASSPWALNVVGYSIIFMTAEMPFFLLVTLFIDHPTIRMFMRTFFRIPRRGKGGNGAQQSEDDAVHDEEDVAMERDRVIMNKDNAEQDLVQVVNLRKVYGNGKVAVRNLTFGVRPGEVFGFLGTNGAGKTTTISILCQEVIPTSGRALVCGKNVVTDSAEALRHIGYCPQFDALLELLTVEEHLWLYAGIRGVVPEQRERVVWELLQLAELTQYKKTFAGKLSGGNKRKLSVALALIGGPRVVFLDEPSAGMDPVARRGLWTAIQTISNTCSIVLTTHHLEEVEVLAHRVAIMVEGKLRCLGNKTHLKNKYGQGFEMTIRTAEDVTRVSMDEFIHEFFPTATLDEVRGQRYTYALPATTALSSVFAELERHKDSIGITDYSVSQTSIEQVFLRISEGANADSAASQQQNLLDML